MRALRNLKILAALLALWALVGMAGFHYLEGWPWFDGFYMVVITITTIGYGEVHPLSHQGRVFNVALILSGAVLAALTIGLLTQALLEFEFVRFLGRRRMERGIERLSGHFIICGAGRVGRSVARELARKPAPFVIIEADAARLERLNGDWLAMLGDATQEAALRTARIERAHGLVAATTTDATNIYIVLTARALNPGLKIIARASEEGAEKHLRTAGADSVISPYTFAGHRIAQSFLRPHVVDFIDLATAGGELDLEIEEIPVSSASSLVGLPIGASKIHSSMGVIVLAIKRPGLKMRFNPTARDLIAAGDHLIAIGEAAGLRQLERAAAPQAEPARN